jgi:serine/threonine protein kinase
MCTHWAASQPSQGIICPFMSLTPGTRLGPYEIQTPLGAGGMGEVYRARDTRLDRTVAIKILPTHLSSNPESKLRFDREARVISSLNHPNICTLYDVGHQNGMDFLVMEYLEGETLADRLVKGSLPTEQVLKQGVEICEGLETAHRKGVIHRDLKPGNIMLTKTGAKLMDFGLAKAMLPGQPLRVWTSPSPARQRVGRSQHREHWSELFNTCPQSRWKAQKPMHGPTFSRLAQSFMKWQRGTGHSRARARRTS